MSSQELSNQSAPSRLGSPNATLDSYRGGLIEWYDSPGQNQDLSQRSRILKIASRTKSADSFAASPSTSTAQLDSPAGLRDWWNLSGLHGGSDSQDNDVSDIFLDESARCTDMTTNTPRNRSTASSGRSSRISRRYKGRSLAASEGEDTKEGPARPFAHIADPMKEALLLAEHSLQARLQQTAAASKAKDSKRKEYKAPPPVRPPRGVTQPLTPRSRARSACYTTQYPVNSNGVNRKRPADTSQKVSTPSASRNGKLTSSTPISGTTVKRFCPGKVLSPIVDSTPLSLRRHKTTSEIPTKPAENSNATQKKPAAASSDPKSVLPRSVSMTSHALDLDDAASQGSQDSQDSFFDDPF